MGPLPGRTSAVSLLRFHYARYKRHQNLYCAPMGYDSFGLPAEQYAIQTGQRTTSTSVNIDGGFDKEGNKIAGYRKQLDNWVFIRQRRELQIRIITTYPMDFIQLFNSWYNKDNDKDRRCFNFDFNF
jgi:leucyl-tRNA synthetase